MSPFSFTEKKGAQILFLIALVSRIIAFFFMDGINADAVSRVLMSVDWLKDPHFIVQSTWGPHHFYLLALVISIFNEHVIAPYFINIILGSWTVVLVYKMSTRLYDRNSAMMAALFFSFMPLVFRQHLTVLAGTPTIFFIAQALYLLLLNIQAEKETWTRAVWAGFLYTIACGIRFEAWLLLPIFSFIVLTHKKWKTLFLFGAIACIFPILWMILNQIYAGDYLYSIHKSALWNINVGRVNENITTEKIYMRIWFMSVVNWLNISLIIFLWWAIELFKKWKNRSIQWNQLIWLLPFVYFFIIMQYKTYLGDVNLHPRYQYTSLFLLAPHFAIIYPKNRKWPLFIMLGSVIFHFTISFRYHKWSFEDVFRPHENSYAAVKNLRMHIFKDQTAVPLLRDPVVANTRLSMQEHLLKSDGLLMEFDSWISSYYFALHSGFGMKRNHFIYFSTMDHLYDLPAVKNYVINYPEGLLMLKNNLEGNKHLQLLDENVLLIDDHFRLKVKKLEENESYLIFRYHSNDE